MLVLSCSCLVLFFSCLVLVLLDLDLEKVDGLKRDAYGVTLIHSSEVDSVDAWYQRWNTIVHLQGKVYDLPGDAVGRKYVDFLS